MTLLRLWPATNGPAATTTDTDNYTMGVEFGVSAAATAKAVYLWRPATSPATTLAVGIYQVTGAGTTGTLLGSVTGVSVPANLGAWHRVQLTIPVALNSGISYKAVVQSSTDNFYASTAAYWSTGPGAAGISNGILSAPNADNAANGQGTFVASTTLTYPTGSFNASNYWIDVEVDDGVSVVPSGGAAGTLAWAGTAGGAVARSGGATGVLAWAGTAGGATVRSGAAAGALAWAGSASGEAPVVGAAEGGASGTLAWTGAAGGSRASSGSAAGVLAWSGEATGTNGDALSIADENALTDDVHPPAYWMDYPAEEIPAFVRSSYYTPGQTAQFSVDYAAAYTVEIWRLGWYGGDGARRIASFAGDPASQPAPATIPGSNGAVTCSAWSVNDEWEIPTDVTPGAYWAFFKDAPNDNWAGVPFFVSDANNKKPILVVASDSTWCGAYNYFGAAGKSVYGSGGPLAGTGGATTRALCGSYDRPMRTRDGVPQTNFLNGELPQLRFLERFGFEVGYATNEQINNDPSIMDGRSLVVFSGHNEYTSQRVRDKTVELIAAGVNVANFAGNDFFWRVAYGDEIGFPTGQTDTSTGRVMWCRKDTMAGPSTHVAGAAFTTADDWTGTWQDTRWPGRQPSSELLGDRFIANGVRNDEVKVPFALKTAPIWRDCDAIGALTAGQTFTFGAGTAGMEWDIPADDLPSTALSASTVNLEYNASDINGEDYNQDGTYTHAFQMVASGAAYVFNANTTQWGWALDDLHDRGGNVATDEAVQATLNVLYDLGAEATGSLVAGDGFVEPTPVVDLATAYALPGPPPGEGAASGTLAWTGSASGATARSGQAAGTLSWSGTAEGASGPSGTATGTLAWLGTASGRRESRGGATGTLQIAGTASGTTTRSGAAGGTLAWVGTATGGNPSPGRDISLTVTLAPPRLAAAALAPARFTTRLEAP
ncbi:N,N-dimethylformamidase beta subunit family domain-containing protein [Nocardioides sp. LHG3406-4]|uniref:N,N-dimethylformamidase beta subunit family domain-containing protein n=1 Tax=Nocardioides sp. LHG3406-4 TaxID=2804575 RepID=UPI003CEF500E